MKQNNCNSTNIYIYKHRHKRGNKFWEMFVNYKALGGCYSSGPRFGMGRPQPGYINLPFNLFFFSWSQAFMIHTYIVVNTNTYVILTATWEFLPWKLCIYGTRLDKLGLLNFYINNFITSLKSVKLFDILKF